MPKSVCVKAWSAGLRNRAAKAALKTQVRKFLELLKAGNIEQAEVAFRALSEVRQRGGRQCGPRQPGRPRQISPLRPSESG